MPARKTADEEYIRGRMHEVHTLPLMQQIYNNELFLNPEPFGAFDYHTPDNTLFAELKYRRIAHDAFGSLLLSAFKWREGLKHKADGARVVFVWKCTDGFYAYEMDDKADEISVAPFTRTGRRPSDSVDVPSGWMRKISALEWGGGPFIVNFD